LRSQAADGGFAAEALGERVSSTQADNWDEMRADVRETAQALHFDFAPPASIWLRVVRDEVVTVL